MKKYYVIRILLSLILSFSLALSLSSPTYAAGKNKKTTVSKSSPIYKELTTSGMFDYDYYAKNNPDVVEVLGSGKSALLNHFLNYGIYEGRQPNADFNINAYASAYADLRAAFDNESNVKQSILDYYNHYARYGKKEGRSITSLEAASSAGITVTKIGDKEVLGASTTTPATGSVNNSSGSTSAYANLYKIFCRYVNPNCPLEPHSYGERTIIAPATSDSCAQYSETCTRCGYSHVASDHSITVVVMRDATSTEDGYDLCRCRYCDYVLTGSIGIIHYMGSWEDCSPTADNPCGGQQRKCVNCDYVEYQKHISGPIEVITECADGHDGRNEWHCVTCGVLTGYSITHDWKPWTVEAESQYTGTWYIRYCNNCDDYWRSQTKY